MSVGEQIGNAIANIAKSVNTIKEDALVDETDGTYLVGAVETLKLNVTMYAWRRNYSTTSFVIDHPVYGDIDSSVLYIDGDYQYDANEFPLEFPISWNELVGSTLIGSYSS